MSGDYVRIGYYTAQPMGIDPFHAFDPDSFVAVSACHNSLMDIGGNGELKGSLATAWKRISPTCMAVSLRKNIYFHNGEPFDARAVVTTINAHCNPDNYSPLGWFVFKSIRCADIIESDLVHIHTHFPDSMLPWRLALFSAIVPPNLLDEKGVDYFRNHPVGTGPFVFEEMVENQYIDYRVNPDYWGKRPTAKGIRFVILPSAYLVEALMEDKLDLIYGLNGSQLALLRNVPDITIQSRLCALSHWFMFASKGPLLDLRVRHAMNLAVDNRMLAKFHALDKAIPQAAIGTRKQFGFNPDVRPYPYDKQKALALLSEAGYSDGFRLTGVVADHSAGLVQMIAAYLADINIKLDYTIIPRAEFMLKMIYRRMTGKGSYQGDFTVTTMDNPVMHIGLLHYAILHKEGPLSLFNDSEFHQRFDAAMTRQDEKSSQHLLMELEQYVHDKALLLFTIQTNIHLPTRPGIHMEILENGHLDTFSWESLEDRRPKTARAGWRYDYLEKDVPVSAKDMLYVIKGTQNSGMIWFSETHPCTDKRIERLVKNLQIAQQEKIKQDRMRYDQIVGLLDRANEYEHLLEASSFAGIAVFDIQGTPVMCNQSFINILGEGANNCTLQSFFKLRPRWPEFEATLKNEQGFSGSVDLSTPNGRVFKGRIACSLRMSELKNPIGYLLIAVDESKERALSEALKESHRELEQKVAERTRELAQAKEAAEAASHAKSDFLARMSHEIRTPLNAVTGLTNIVLKSELTAAQRDYLNKVQIASNNLLEVINDILDFSKVEAGQLELANNPFDLNGVMEQLADLFSNRVGQKDLELIFYMTPDVPHQLTGDAGRLIQVLTNLIENAIKFTDTGEIVVGIKTKNEGQEALEKRQHLIFEVSDTGIGVDPDLLPTLFEPFTQADSYLTRRHEGTGLGLSICRRLVELMGGRIWAESTVGRGSTFSFTVILTVQEEIKPRLNLPPDLHGSKTLVVENTASSRQALTNLLESFNFKVDSVDRGEKAIAAFQRESYQLVLINWKLPDMDGIETARRIRELERQGTNIKYPPKIPSPQTGKAQTPIIIMTTAYTHEFLQKQIDKTAFGTLLLKPIKSSQLFNTVLELLGKDDVAAPSHPQEPVSHPIHGLSGRRVLVVEDSELNRDVAVALLKEVGLIVETAEHGRNAVAKVAESPKGFYDAVLMDIQMPMMNGYQATRKIREFERKPEATDEQSETKTPIIALTAHALKGEKKKCLDAGMDDYLAKPLDEKDLHRVLLKWIAPQHGRC